MEADCLTLAAMIAFLSGLSSVVGSFQLKDNAVARYRWWPFKPLSALNKMGWTLQGIAAIGVSAMVVVLVACLG